MYVPLNALPDSAKVWIYQSHKSFSEAEKKIINDHLASFTETWKVHGEALNASFDIVHDHFVILAADDVASGCSIDSSVKTMRELANILEMDFFDRTAIAFLIEGGIRLIPLGSLKAAFAENQVGPDTPVFNNAIATLGEFRESWPAPVRKSWVSRYFPKESAEK
jgi:hypothetical protein